MIFPCFSFYLILEPSSETSSRPAFDCFSAATITFSSWEGKVFHIKKDLELLHFSRTFQCVTLDRSDSLLNFNMVSMVTCAPQMNKNNKKASDIKICETSCRNKIKTHPSIV